MDEIQITLAEVTNTAVLIRQHNMQLQEKLMMIKKMMNDLEVGWQSPASLTIREKLNGMLPLFSNYYEIIESYAKFLEQAVLLYEQTERSILQQANSFR